LGRNLLSSAWLGSPNGYPPVGVLTLLPRFSSRKHFRKLLIFIEIMEIREWLMNISPSQSIQ